VTAAALRRHYIRSVGIFPRSDLPRGSSPRGWGRSIARGEQRDRVVVLEVLGPPAARIVPLVIAQRAIGAALEEQPQRIEVAHCGSAVQRGDPC
jgi:hypothetical protein